MPGNDTLELKQETQTTESPLTSSRGWEKSLVDILKSDNLRKLTELMQLTHDPMITLATAELSGANKTYLSIGISTRANRDGRFIPVITMSEAVMKPGQAIDSAQWNTQKAWSYASTQTGGELRDMESDNADFQTIFENTPFSVAGYSLESLQKRVTSAIGQNMESIQYFQAELASVSDFHRSIMNDVVNCRFPNLETDMQNGAERTEKQLFEFQDKEGRTHILAVTAPTRAPSPENRVLEHRINEDGKPAITQRRWNIQDARIYDARFGPYYYLYTDKLGTRPDILLDTAPAAGRRAEETMFAGWAARDPAGKQFVEAWKSDWAND